MPREQLRGTVQTDILKEYIAQKEWIFPPEPSMRLVADMVECCAQRDAADAPDLDLRLPHPRGRLDRGAGARVHARRRLRATSRRASSAASTSTSSRRGCPSSSTRTSTSSRRSRSTAPRAASGRGRCATSTARRTRARWLMRFHTQTAGVSLTAQQPEVNIVRTAIEALAAVLGGTQSLHTNSFDEALALPTENAVRHRAAHAAGDRARDRRREHDRPARRLVLRRAADERARAAGVRLLRADRGARRRRSRRSRRTSSSARSPRRASATSPRSSAASASIVGVNRYELEDEQPIEILRIDPALEQKQIERVQAVRARRDSARGRGGARAAEGGRGARGPQPDGADHRGLARLRDDGRDVRRAPRGVGHVARDARLLDGIGVDPDLDDTAFDGDSAPRSRPLVEHGTASWTRSSFPGGQLAPRQ